MTETESCLACWPSTDNKSIVQDLQVGNHRSRHTKISTLQRWVTPGCSTLGCPVCALMCVIVCVYILQYVRVCWTASRSFNTDSMSTFTCSPVQYWKLRACLYDSVGFGDGQRSLLPCNWTVIDGGADGIATGPPRPPGGRGPTDLQSAPPHYGIVKSPTL